MKTRLSLVFSLVCLMVMPVLAHHSFDAEYDSTKTLTVSSVTPVRMPPITPPIASGPLASQTRVSEPSNR